MCGAILPFPQHVFMACCLVKRRDNFTFTLRMYEIGGSEESLDRKCKWTGISDSRHYQSKL
jgi:hypothetical protein